MVAQKRIISDQTCWVVTSFIGYFIILVSMLILIGWAFDFELLKRILPFWITAKANTAICFILSGFCLLLLSNQKISRSRRLIVNILSIILFMIGALTLSEYCFKIDAHIDQLLFIDHVVNKTHSPGRMSLATALSFILIAITFFLLDKKWLKQWVYQVFASIVFPLALIGVFNFFFKVDMDYIASYYFYMAFQVAMLFMLLCFAIFLLRPHIGLTNLLLADTIGGRFVRRVLPLVLILPEIIIYIVNLGDFNHIYGENFTDTVLSVVFITIISLIAYFNAYRINLDEQEIFEKEEALLKSEKLFRSFAENSDDVFWEAPYTLDKILYVSDAVKKIWGIPKENFYANPDLWLEVIVPEDRPRVESCYFNDLLKTNKMVVEYRIKRPDGTIRHIYDRGYLLQDQEGNPLEVIGVAIDVTDVWQRTRQEQILSAFRNVLHDVTDINTAANKLLFFLCQMFEWDVGEIWLINQDTQILSLLDRFDYSVLAQKSHIHTSQNIRMMCGLPFPNKILKEKKIIWITDLNKEKNISIIEDMDISQFKSLMGMPLLVQDTLLGVIIFFGNRTHEPDDTLLKLLESITIQFSTFLQRTYVQNSLRKLMHINAEHIQMEKALHDAMTNKQFVLYYQPKIDLKTGKIISVEALIRWLDPKRGLIFPNTFIPLAEETGLIIPMTEWVLREVCQTLKQPWFTSQYIAVNMSAQCFIQQNHLPEMLAKLIKELTIDAKRIELEVTESVFLQETQDGIDIIDELVKMGFHFAIDDFGVGYSSLSYLVRIPSSKIKIDISLIKELPYNSSHIKIIRSIISLAHQLEKLVVAEGVETEEQLSFLMNEGCDIVQGYYFSKPLPIDDLHKFMTSNPIMKLPDLNKR